MLSILAPVGTCEGFLTNVPCRVWEQSKDLSARTPDGVGITRCLELLRPSDPHAGFLFVFFCTNFFMAVLFWRTGGYSAVHTRGR